MTADRRAFGYIALIFVSGLLLGGTVMNLVEHYWLHARVLNQPTVASEQQIAHLIGDRLHLSSEQRDQVNNVLRQVGGQYAKLDVGLQPKIDSVRAQARQQIRSILNDGQRRQFDEIVAHVDAQSAVAAADSTPRCTDLVAGH